MLPNIAKEVRRGVVARFPAYAESTEIDIGRLARHRRLTHCWGFDEDDMPTFNGPPLSGVSQSSSFVDEDITHHDSLVRLSHKLLGVYFDAYKSSGTDHTKVRQIRLNTVDAFQWGLHVEHRVRNAIGQVKYAVV